MNPYRPADNEAFAERLRSAEAKKRQEEAGAVRSPRVTNKAKAQARKAIEEIRERIQLEYEAQEVWEMDEPDLMTRAMFEMEC